MEELIVLDQVSKWYGRHAAVQDITWRINRGECVAVTGGNGAGKSTLLHLIAGLAVPSQGKRVIRSSSLRVGYVPERFPSLRFTPKQYLIHMARIQGLNAQAALHMAEGMLSLFHMEQHAERSMNHFSKGMLQKVNLMQAMLSTPDLLILDEPLSGLDEGSQYEMIRILEEIKHSGKAIAMSVHEPLLTAALADRMVFMEEGRVVRDALHEQVPESKGVMIRFHGLSPDALLKLETLNGFLYFKSRGTPAEIVIQKDFSDEMLLFVLNSGGSVISVES
ncbi:ABC transporter ATP-binding protein [Paenibacillus dakarensis]|uniref:ABC transporter ATP-binding protein n=1 Tax=Paenibacillus dakarensis TaxID=1527293 RepID=UPI0006D59353|nr:ABC transporter ATP-binding protein [Paenibacillus dakarensis]